MGSEKFEVHHESVLELAVGPLWYAGALPSSSRPRGMPLGARMHYFHGRWMKMTTSALLREATFLTPRVLNPVLGPASWNRQNA